MVHKTNIYELKILNSVLFFGFAMFLACFADLASLK
jgi:hypothetical protein